VKVTGFCVRDTLEADGPDSGNVAQAWPAGST